MACLVNPPFSRKGTPPCRIHARQVDKSSVSRVISGKAELSATMAVRLSQVFDLSAEAWMGMQTAHSLMLARKHLAKMGVGGTELAPA
ncbi:HigA family addiction module antidote protein [Massilia sp. CCM 8693]|uniref:HigA family addiction module antidote protein n=1 Tax=Massilia aquatica TaxID=2609000 RepID=A0ABX0LWU8_9BURK|nr:HigA family addiction module antidote protein [Massilia aquatica]